MNKKELLSRKQYIFLIPVLMVSAIIAEEMATDIFLPSLPLMGDYFGVGEVKAQLTISMYLLGLSIARPFYGILSDSFGRRKVLIGGLILFFTASIICFLSETISVLIAGRFAQGWGAGVAIVIGFAAVKDVFDEKKGAQILSIMGMVIAVSPALAPILGGYLSKYYGWQSTFLFITIFSGLILLSTWLFMAETLPKEKYVKFSVLTAIQNYISVLIHRRFIFYVFVQALAVGSLWGWLAGAPVLYIDHLGIPVEMYGYFGAVGVGCYMLGTCINLILIRRFAHDTVLMFGIGLMATGDILLLGASFFGADNPVIIQALFSPFATGLALILPNATNGALGSIESGRGIGASIIGTMQMGFSSLSSFFVGYFATGTLTPIACILSVMTLLSATAFTILIKIKFDITHPHPTQ